MSSTNLALSAVSVMWMVVLALPALAVSPVEIETDVNACEPTMVSATADGASVTNMYLVVDTVDGTVQSANIPTDGSSADLSVGPFFSDTTVYWHVFGGGERDYDIPLWNGYGTPGFGTDIGAYAGMVGGYDWVISETTDLNPFVTWNDFVVPGCAPETMDDCKNGGWEAYSFKNQGQCIRFIETGKDSRIVE